MKTYTIDGKSIEFDESKMYLDFFIQHGEPVFAEVTYGKLLDAIQAGEVKIQEMERDLILLDRWVKEAPRKRMWRRRILDGATTVQHDGVAIEFTNGEYFFENAPDDKAEEVFIGLENTGHFARKLLETFLPECAAQCQQDRHPAEKYYVGPL